MGLEISVEQLILLFKMYSGSLPHMDDIRARPLIELGYIKRWNCDTFDITPRGRKFVDSTRSYANSQIHLTDKNSIISDVDQTSLYIKATENLNPLHQNS